MIIYNGSGTSFWPVAAGESEHFPPCPSNNAFYRRKNKWAPPMSSSSTLPG